MKTAEQWLKEKGIDDNQIVWSMVEQKEYRISDIFNAGLAASQSPLSDEEIEKIKCRLNAADFVAGERTNLLKQAIEEITRLDKTITDLQSCQQKSDAVAFAQWIDNNYNKATEDNYYSRLEKYSVSMDYKRHTIIELYALFTSSLH